MATKDNLYNIYIPIWLDLLSLRVYVFYSVKFEFTFQYG